MKLTINGESKALEMHSLTVLDLLNQEKVSMPDTVSVQLNGTFVRPEAFASTALHEGDEVDFLYFMGGGAR